LKEFLTNLLGQSYKTTIGGILLGVPPIIQSAAMSAGVSLGKWGAFIMALSMGIGGLMLGISAKDSTVHSTEAQVKVATNEAPLTSGTASK
jgi:hypothetical protein